MSSFITALPPVEVLPTRGATGISSGPAPTGMASFSQVLSDVVGGSVDTLARAESTAISALQNKANLQSVVESITSAEQTLQTVLAVRDKAVSAWQDVSHMSI